MDWVKFTDKTPSSSAVIDVLFPVDLVTDEIWMLCSVSGGIHLEWVTEESWWRPAAFLPPEILESYEPPKVEDDVLLDGDTLQEKADSARQYIAQWQHYLDSLTAASDSRKA